MASQDRTPVFSYVENYNVQPSNSAFYDGDQLAVNDIMFDFSDDKSFPVAVAEVPVVDARQVSIISSHESLVNADQGLLLFDSLSVVHAGAAIVVGANGSVGLDAAHNPVVIAGVAIEMELG